MFNVVLYQPEIPANTGNIIRLCANTGARLHLVEPLGFELDDKKLRRAGLDYHEWASVKSYADIVTCLSALSASRVYALSTKGRTSCFEASFRAGDILLFGPETLGLPGSVLNSFSTDCVLRVPMIETSRSLNLANTVAVVVYEALRQNGFTGLQ